MWVRLRSWLPGEATRSSTWNSDVCSQGISSWSLRIASIAHGVRPPLIASANEPRSSTAARPAAAISSAPRRAAVPLPRDDLEGRRHSAYFFSSCPPNCLRMAERTLSPKSSRSRE